jgi:hypothetical protein
LPQILLALLLGVFVVIAIDAVLYPWIYIVGGKLRPWPVWQGTGIVETPAGPYRIALWFSPKPGGSRILPSTGVLGSGYVCTPRGERYSLRVTGGASGNIWRDMDGHEFHLSAYHRPVFWNFSDSKTWRPRLSFSGRWVGPNLVMSDEGSIANAFLADGTLNIQAANWHSNMNARPITLAESGWWPGGAACNRADK